MRNFTAALNEDPTRALQYELRDKRFDSVLRRSEQLTADQIERMTNQYINGAALPLAVHRAHRGHDCHQRWSGRGAALWYCQRCYPQSSAVMALKAARLLDSDEGWAQPRGSSGRAWHESSGVEPGGVFRTPLGPMHYPRDPAGSAANVIRCRCRIRWRWK